MPAQKSSPIDPWAEMDAIAAKTKEPMGPEWFYEQDFSSRYGLSQAGGHRRLNIMVKAGMVEKWKGRALGCNAPKCKYRLKQPAQKKSLQKAR